MHRKQREREILELVATRGELSIGEACRDFAISPATARRDFARLASLGLAQKTWGGLMRLDGYPAADMVPSGVRESRQAAQKECIAVRRPVWSRTGTS